MVERLRCFLARFLGAQPRHVRARLILRPGDLLIVQPKLPLSGDARVRLHQQWQARFGGQYPMAILPSDWKITVAREEPR